MVLDPPSEHSLIRGDILLEDRAVLLATCEVLARSMNGYSARRLAFVLQDLAIDPEGSLLDHEDRQWIQKGVEEATSRTNRIQRWRDDLGRLDRHGVTVLACFDEGYPTNLTLTHDHPPLLFVLGELIEADRRSISIVGTRDASTDGLAMAGRLVRELADRRVTIVSGLARGIDTAAHSAALNAGGRTIAVYGTTIDHVYPKENKTLARAIRWQGACLSQFLPGMPTGRWAFPARNITASGLSLGTVVIEASETSGAKRQAEAAIAHGKRVFLFERLVADQPWASSMAETQALVTAVTDADDILEVVDADFDIAEAVLF